jgi:hypothetical protein
VAYLGGRGVPATAPLGGKREEVGRRRGRKERGREDFGKRKGKIFGNRPPLLES